MGWKDRAERPESSQSNAGSWKSRAVPISRTESTDSGLDESLARKALGVVQKVGETYDKYTGAPTRAAIGAAQEGKNPIPAFISQFGADRNLAPTGYDIAAKAGVDDEPMAKFSVRDISKVAGSLPGPLGMVAKAAGSMIPQAVQEKQFQPSARDVTGFAIDIGADPLNIIPATAVLKGAARGAKAVGEISADVAKIAGRSAVKAAGAEKLVERASETANLTKQALENIFKPKQAETFETFANIAAKNGIDPKLLPESIEFGHQSVISRLARNLREGPIGQEALDKFNDAYHAVQDAANNQITKIGGAKPLSEVEAGNAIRVGYDNAVERLFNDVDFTYNSVINQAPGIKLTPQSMASLESKLSGLEKFAKGRVARGITNTERGQGEQILRAIESVRAGNGSLKQVYEAMSDIGKHAFKEGQNAFADIPVDQKKFQELYFTLRDEFINSTAAQLGEDTANALITSNQIISDFTKNRSAIAKILGNKNIAPETLFNNLVKNGDTKEIAALKEMLTPEELNQLKGAFLENLIKRNPDGTVNFGTLFNALRGKKNTISVLFEPQEIADFLDVVKLGDAFGPSVLSTSGTGGSNLFREIVSGVQSGVANKTVLDNLKDSARGRTVTRPINPQNIDVKKAIESRIIPRRSGPEEALKYSQAITAASDQREGSPSAAKRRLNEILKKKNEK